MPEIITKFPDVVLQILKVVGKCGVGAKQQILTTCPPDRFCSLPTGEICVYGIQDIPKMTQISAQELAQIVSTAPATDFTNVFLLPVVLVIGFLLGILITKR